MNSDKISEKMNDLLTFVDLLVKQTCRRAAYDYQMRSKPIKEDKASIYSLDYLKKVHDKPRENIYKLVKNPQKTLKGLKVDNGFNGQKKDNKFTKIEQRMLLDFVEKVKDQAPPRQLLWIDLQHYLYYVYRNFACPNPDPSAEVLSTFFICEMKELVDNLKKEDESQVWLRVFTLLREYCIFAQWHYTKNCEEHALLKFFCYYEAMLTAAKNLVPVFSDFERDVIYKRYKVCWVDFNTFIFIRFFYESGRVKTRLAECVKTKNVAGEAPQMFTLFSELKKLWTEEQNRIGLINQEGKLAENSPEFGKEKKVIAAHKKVLAGNFWVERTKEEKKKIDLSRLDHNIFDLLRDREFFPEGPGLNKNGQCICEECLICKYKLFLDCQPANDFIAIRSSERTTVCRKCKTMLKLEVFQRHINSHVMDSESQRQPINNRPTNLTRIIAEKMDFVKMGDRSVSLSEMLSEKLRISKSQNTEECSDKMEMDTTKLAFEKFLRQTRDSPTNTEHLFNKNGRNVIKIKKDLLNGISKKEPDSMRKDKSNSITSKLEKLTANGSQEIPVSINTEKLGETELRIRDIRRNWHKPYPMSRISKCTGTDDDSPSGVCPGHVEPDNVEQKKCDCTYCEVFGAVHKYAELRDRLRLRLNQRREKKSVESQQNLVSNGGNAKVNKTESRVSATASPTNMPSSISVSSEPSVGVKEISDIHGLVNYIEGNSAINKIELAKKKAAKKARQRERREQERIQAELDAKRKAEEKEHRKKEQERKQEELKLLEAQTKKKLKKQRQQLKKLENERLKNIVEETIPAMVTIKRVSNTENGTPAVTITLKGYTPDQDKLLYTLVEDPKDEGKDTKIEPVVSKELNKAKKKIKNKPLQVQEKEPKVVAKEVKVMLAVDKNSSKAFPDTASDNTCKKPIAKVVNREVLPTEDEMRALGNLRLPPGITITKVEGPLSNRNRVGSDASKASSIVGKSGVIVVDTEKLIHNNDGGAESVKVSKSSKKKRKNKKNMEMTIINKPIANQPKMVTLKNPLFQQYQNAKPLDNIDNSAPASIFTSENGMVTIRSSRLQQSLNNDAKQSNAMKLPMPILSNMMPEIPNLINPNKFTPGNCINVTDDGRQTPLNAQEILSGLPGIEITKVDKKLEPVVLEDKGSYPDAQVSIIPSPGNGKDSEFGKDDDDWLYDNVFKPRDVLEDDMDDEELELEAFKRFCQQSVPPKCKEKVAHLNVADIVLKKKTC
ncbi:uncharacterized protein LOC132695608 isoform X2 [Cylas formicarius]|uniref:uncharacterized protein LOC132695608 isoform X2 n=1 Tax=Cylas formicarius TaxID=197179 RepID=UPI0029584E88|nr:uncharacterized protein LOC132695608 isoform X2 [Cylas formicarius]